MFQSEHLALYSVITVHSAATRPSMDIGFKEINQWHLDRGWSGCGYHLIIRRDGTFEMGRPWNRQGAHVGGANRNPLDGKLNFGIVMAGGVREDNHLIPEDNFTDAQYQSLNYALYHLMKNSDIKDFKGHNEWKGHESRGCPSFDIKTYRQWFKSAVSSLYLPDDWMKYDWKDGIDKDWNEVNLMKEINVDQGRAE